jgi:hypothetical protein
LNFTPSSGLANDFLLTMSFFGWARLKGGFAVGFEFGEGDGAFRFVTDIDDGQIPGQTDYGAADDFPDISHFYLAAFEELRE